MGPEGLQSYTEKKSIALGAGSYPAASGPELSDG
jgi:hypothetical protein